MNSSFSNILLNIYVCICTNVGNDFKQRTKQIGIIPVTWRTTAVLMFNFTIYIYISISSLKEGGVMCTLTYNILCLEYIETKS